MFNGGFHSQINGMARMRVNNTMNMGNDELMIYYLAFPVH